MSDDLAGGVPLDGLPMNGAPPGGLPLGGGGAAGPGAQSSAERSYVRVVRPGGRARHSGDIPPMPVGPPSALPPWLAGDPSLGGRSGMPEADLLPEESELRELLHRSVEGLQPAADSLEKLRRAVPLRRARRRRCGGVASAVVLGVLGGLALHSLAIAGSTSQGPQSGPGYQNAATASSARSGSAGPSSNPVPYLPGPTGGGPGWASPAGASGSLSGTQPGSRSGSSTPWTGGASAAKPGSGGAPSAAECTRVQLGNGAASVGTADSDGTVYGSFQVTNVSQATCQVSQPGTVAVVAVSGTLASRITVVQHTATDPASLLPAPTPTPGPVVLPPGQSYAVDFAWVPATGADAPSCTDGSPTATASASGGGSGGGTPAATAPTADPQDSPPSTSSPSGSQPTVTLGHTPGAGSPLAASAVLTGACAGTVYDTSPLATG